MPPEAKGLRDSGAQQSNENLRNPQAGGAVARRRRRPFYPYSYAQLREVLRLMYRYLGNSV